jgi:flavin-dependent dehydrogenase
MVKDVDVLVVGAGPAGATAALNLASSRQVLMVDSRSFDSAEPTIGESLAPAAGRLLADMGLLKSFLTHSHKPCYGNRSVWGIPSVYETDFLRDLDGHGWHLDRRQFETHLREEAIHRGGVLLASASLRKLEFDSADGCWHALISTGDSQSVLVRARILIDATGRSASIARRLGANHEIREPRMICAWLKGHVDQETAGTAGFTLLEAVENGWWYTAALPGARRVLAFHTDPDLPVARRVRSTNLFLKHAASAQHLTLSLSDCGFTAANEQVRLTVASGGSLSPPSGARWFAAGDAAIHFDPLSSQGLLNALFTGLASAEAADRVLSGEDALDVSATYVSLLRGIQAAYDVHRRWWYDQETRWQNETFWARRQSRTGFIDPIVSDASSQQIS